MKAARSGVRDLTLTSSSAVQGPIDPEVKLKQEGLAKHCPASVSTATPPTHGNAFSADLSFAARTGHAPAEMPAIAYPSTKAELPEGKSQRTGRLEPLLQTSFALMMRFRSVSSGPGRAWVTSDQSQGRKRCVGDRVRNPCPALSIILAP